MNHLHVKVEILGGLLCAGLLVLILAALLSDWFLQLACSLYNKMSGGAGSADSVPEPDFNRAFVIAIVTKMVCVAVVFLLVFVLNPFLLKSFGRDRFPLAFQLVNLPASFLVMSTANAILLPTTFSRGVQITLFYLLVTFVVGLAIGFLIVGFIMLFPLALHGGH